MADINKVLQGILHCAFDTKFGRACESCPYDYDWKHGISCWKSMCADVVKLLTEKKDKDKDVPTKWTSVKDKPPEVRHAVLGYTPSDENVWAVTMHEDGCWYFWYPGTSKYDPDWYGPITHWMPMPEPPQKEKL